jgi:hypothetical protein
MGQKQVREFENELVGMQGGIALYRRGIDEYFVSHGFAIARVPGVNYPELLATTIVSGAVGR